MTTRNNFFNYAVSTVRSLVTSFHVCFTKKMGGKGKNECTQFVEVFKDTLGQTLMGTTRFRLFHDNRIT